jgi:hypothetical protein
MSTSLSRKNRSRLTGPHRGKDRLDIFQMAKAISKHLSKDRGNFVPYCGGIEDGVASKKNQINTPRAATRHPK